MAGKCKARVANVSNSILVKRPSWINVYKGYPKNNTGTDDLPASEVFTDILGSNYDKSIYANACATRVSLGLIRGGMNVKPAFKIQNKQHQYYNKGFQSSALGLKDWLSQKSVWGQADIIICEPKSLNEVANIINSGYIKNGVYIIIGGFQSPTTGHATLWIGNQRNVIGGHNYIIGAKQTIYFWELK